MEFQAALGLSPYVKWARGGDGIGTHLQSELQVSYADLVKLFGEPEPHVKGDGKTDAEWHLTFQSFGQFEEVATIYNYKDGPNYLGAEGTPVEQIRDWHIGGRRGDVVGYIASMLLNAEAQP